jgi:hypothetical protein
VKKMVIVALYVYGAYRKSLVIDGPSMNNVIEMFEGGVVCLRMTLGIDHFVDNITRMNLDQKFDVIPEQE